jgi:hypothetical protein
MDISNLSNSGLATLAQALQTQKLQQQVGTAVLAIANDQIKQDGQNALKLIASASLGPVGGNLDVTA